MASIAKQSALPLLLSINGGYLDTAGFLALQGLFTAHVTGNFVTLGATLALGTSGVVAKLLALPVFCIVVIVTRTFGNYLSTHGLSALRTLLGVKVALLGVGAAMAIRWGPFANGDGWQAIVTGLTFVSAMAIQNAAHRIYLPSAPPTTLMTGTTTQVMIDIADLFGAKNTENRDVLHARLVRMLGAVAAFAVGCGSAALLFASVGVLCFLIPPAIGFCAFLSSTAPSPDDRK
jgi:uncharacterized membrane protein YoaK (UPF0700 family)